MSKNKFFEVPKFTKNDLDKFIKKFQFVLGKDYIKKFNTPINVEISDKPYLPRAEELYFLFNFIKINKRLTILEFGSGWSSLFFCAALQENKKRYFDYCKNNIRNSNLFELFVLENEKKFLNISKERIDKFHMSRGIKVNYHCSDVRMTEFQDLYCHEYDRIPLCNPDFIYLDGPDQFKIKAKQNNFVIKHPDLMPMGSDILKIEFFLRPGTIIVIDGRGANFQFLKAFLKRKWIYKYISRIDKYIMYLNAPSLGRANIKNLKFYQKK